MVLSKHVTHYGQRSGFLYYNPTLTDNPKRWIYDYGVIIGGYMYNWIKAVAYNFQ
jgi:hypothetical protein